MRAIFRYIQKDDPGAARDFVADIETKARSLAASGLTGAPRVYISKDLRAFPYRDRCLYFRIVEDQMVVVRVLHSKQDVTAEQFKD